MESFGTPEDDNYEDIFAAFNFSVDLDPEANKGLYFSESNEEFSLQNQESNTSWVFSQTSQNERQVETTQYIHVGTSSGVNSRLNEGASKLNKSNAIDSKRKYIETTQDRLERKRMNDKAYRDRQKEIKRKMESNFKMLLDENARLESKLQFAAAEMKKLQTENLKLQSIVEGQTHAVDSVPQHLKVVFRLDWDDNQAKQRAIITIYGLPGVDSISLDNRGKELTVIGDIDPIHVGNELRTICLARLVRVEPAKKQKMEEALVLAPMYSGSWHQFRHGEKLSPERRKRICSKL